jgi:hypothetical protein
MKDKGFQDLVAEALEATKENGTKDKGLQDIKFLGQKK